jgi:hypothetical protein
MSFLSELEKDTNKSAYTANGAISNQSTLDPLLDFFSNAGAMRGRENEAVNLFKLAYDVDPQNAIRALFYLRDVRGGQGERSVFRAILDSLDVDTQEKVAKYIPEYGRWDEVPLTNKTMRALKVQFEEDEANMKEGGTVSLLAKWLPSENASSEVTKRKAAKLMQAWNLKPSKYRKRVVALRKHIKLLEQKMSAREWAEIQYEKLPTQAHRKHVKAFKRHDESGYDEYMSKVERGEAKINSGTAYTYEIYNMALSGDDRTANAMWKALPDYTKGKNALVLPDVSGSMGWGHSTVAPISVSVSLAIYFAERNKGLFKDYFLSFDSMARLVKVRGTTLSAKINSVRSSTNHMGSTNLQAAFDAILKAARASSATAEEMPSILYIISDMQFNQATHENDETNLEAAKRKFEEAGYELPHIVFWNVNSYGNEAPATMYDNKVTLISGSNQSTFQYAVAGKTPIESMLDILNSNRYASISV